MSEQQQPAPATPDPAAAQLPKPPPPAASPSVSGATASAANAADTGAPAAAADPAEPQEVPSTMSRLRRAFRSGDKKSAREQKEVKIDNKAPRDVQRSAEQDRKERWDDDISNALAELRASKRFFKELATQVGDLSGSSVSGGIGSTIVNVHYASTEGQIDSNSENVAVLRQAELPWPTSAFVACSDNVDDLAFLLSAAVFEGHPIGSVRLVAGDLARRLASEIKSPPDAPPPRPKLHSIDLLFPRLHIRMSREAEEDGSEAYVDRVRFLEPSEAAQLLLHAWARISGFPNWLDHLAGWLIDMGSHKTREIRLAAGRAAGLLWASGMDQIENDLVRHWHDSEITAPLDAVDACFATAAVVSKSLRQKLRKKLWAWGNITYGTDDIFAVRHLCTHRYQQVDPDACFEALEALLTRNNLLGLFQAQDAYEQILVAAIDRPDEARRIAKSVHNVMNKAATDKDQALQFQAILIAISLLQTVRKEKAKEGGKHFFVIDRVLGVSDHTELAQLINEVSRGSTLQPTVVSALRDLFIRGAESCPTANWKDSCILSFFARIYEVGSAHEQERLLYYLEDWSVAASELPSSAGASTHSLIEHLRGVS